VPHKLQGTDLEFPVGVISWELPKAAAERDPKIIRILDAALEQIKPDVIKARSVFGPDKIGVLLGTCDNGTEDSLAAHRALFADGAFPNDYSFRFQSAPFFAEFSSKKFDLSGPVATIATACASSASAIIRGAELIRAGRCDAVIAGGVDVVSHTVLSGFHALEAVSDSLCNPFSKNRKGINLGEGAAFFLLTSEPFTDSPVIELLGAGESADAYHMTAPGIDGAGPAKAMNAALSEAGLKAAQIGYINLHGTGTPHNDIAETLAMNLVFNPTSGGGICDAEWLGPPVSSTKPITGHTLGAAGSLEAAICWMALTQQKGLPVHGWDGIRDEKINIIPGNNREAKPSICMSNSFAFGGCNVSLILGRVTTEGNTND
jgi:3-oxoacyl-[acyl-carrier-protein] synthase-1